jgi:hypothetical protein
VLKYAAAIVLLSHDSVVANIFGGEMACKACASERLQDFPGELTIAFPGVRRLNLSPAYICQKLLVCLDCGFTEIMIPATELEKVRKGME